MTDPDRPTPQPHPPAKATGPRPDGASAEALTGAVRGGAEGQPDPQPDAPLPDPDTQAEQPPESPSEVPPDLPPVSAITLDTDLAPYLKPGIPAAIRNAAMRRKWQLNPVIRDYVDPALDYAWDWNSAVPVPGTGGRMLGESVAKMLRDVMGAPPEDPAADAVPDAPDAPAGEGEAPTAQAEPGDTPPAEPASHSVRIASADAPAPGLASPAATPAGLSDDTAPTPRRRHGGAIPG